ncbi:hypothetical protein [Iningainema tapete]|uniref:Uncharacterized protein n=1 Tax=Iningainema tapete BLCC-T55 TaxID=2748662 RepID=A0A8J7CB30_9CYAN|nr:hypothetical protein [Iningainema tapete]MBD2777856.1 hypothetical protein [Iningainema tapete BLCC-T55]
MLSITGIIFLLFFPASLGILIQVIWGQELTHQLLASGLFLFSIEQARMADQDLQLIEKAKQQVKDIRLNTFSFITISTIFLELIGFYLSSVWLGWGVILIVLSLIWFNLFAPIKIHPEAEIVIQPWKISERLPVLIADAIAFVLLTLWICQIASIWISWMIFGMVLVYCSIKLVLFLRVLI